MEAKRSKAYKMALLTCLALIIHELSSKDRAQCLALGRKIKGKILESWDAKNIERW